MNPIRIPLHVMQPRPARYHAFLTRDGWIGLAVILAVVGAVIWRMAL